MYMYLFNFSFINIYNAKYLIENFKNLILILKICILNKNHKMDTYLYSIFKQNKKKSFLIL